MNQRKTITIIALVLAGLFIGTRIKMVKVGLVMGLIIGLLAMGLVNSKFNEKDKD